MRSIKIAKTAKIKPRNMYIRKNDMTNWKVRDADANDDC